MFDAAHQQVSEGFYIRKVSGLYPSNGRRGERLLGVLAGPSSFYSLSVYEQPVSIINRRVFHSPTVQSSFDASSAINSFMCHSFPISIVVFLFTVCYCSISHS